MAGDAEETLREFWRRQDSGDYPSLVELFADDAVLVDPNYGTMEGRPAIAEFMARMVEVAKEHGVRFSLDELAGGGQAAWARWTAHTPAGAREGVGIYRVRDGKLVYYRDYLNPPPAS